ncbi:MAG: grasp-with-spasm system ATP-grasp peptide maturase [Bacteroidales bacterium]|nr:grasp-with-spasm system ATP-grasp peptide maturase [Bacteroidales bacterium]
MITIITEATDNSTNGVIDWLKFFKKDFIRINYEDYISKIKIELDNQDSNILLNDIDVSKSNAVWYRRGTINFQVPTKKVEDKYKINEKISSHLNKELSKIRDYIHKNFDYNNKSIGNYEVAINTNKLYILDQAKKNKLKIPPTLITDNRDDLEIFYKKHGALITKAISEAPLLSIENHVAYFYTSEVADISNFPKMFFPSLFQKKIEKAYEVRVFFIKNKYYSMAIFSQNDSATSADFRNYNTQKPNRTVPYKLPSVVKKRLKNLMKDLKINTGSIDLLVDKNNDFFFLEVNPVGQYGMVSYPCNYNLDKIIAKELTKIK